MGRIPVAMLVAVVAAATAGGCGARELMPNGAGGTGGGSASGGQTGVDSGPIFDPPFTYGLLSDFEDIAVATIVQAGSPPRNGFWYTYNDATPCFQKPTPTMPYVGEAPPVPSPSATGSLALHGMWSGCVIWGAGIGADLNVPISDGGIYTGPKAPYDLTPFLGITFWAMAMPGSDVDLRFKFPMRATTRIEDGGLCTESSTFKCADDWGQAFALPTNGTWKQITVRFSDATFHQEGWGAAFPWNPADVTSIQIQSVDKGEVYDFWIDDLYLMYPVHN